MLGGGDLDEYCSKKCGTTTMGDSKTAPPEVWMWFKQAASVSWIHWQLSWEQVICGGAAAGARQTLTTSPPLIGQALGTQELHSIGIAHRDIKGPPTAATHNHCADRLHTPPFPPHPTK